MEDDLMKQVNRMLTDVRQGKHKTKKKPKSNGKKSETASTPTSIEIPWKDEALVIIATTHTCRGCGNEVTSWSPYIYIERTRIVRHKVNTIIERLPHCDPDIAYTSLPRRIEHRQHDTCVCHLCFGELPRGFPNKTLQHSLPFDEELKNDVDEVNVSTTISGQDSESD